jgi:hypothetical protein
VEEAINIAATIYEQFHRTISSDSESTQTHIAVLDDTKWVIWNVIVELLSKHAQELMSICKFLRCICLKNILVHCLMH